MHPTTIQDKCKDQESSELVLDLDLDLMASHACGNKMAEEKKVSELPNHSFTCHHG